MIVSQEGLVKYSILRAKTYSSEDTASLLKKIPSCTHRILEPALPG